MLGIILASCSTLSFAVGDEPLPTLTVFPQMKNAIQILSTQHGLWVACYGQGIWHQQGETWELVEFNNVEFNDPEYRYIYYISCMTPGPDNKIYAAPWMGDGLLEIDQATLAVQVIPWPMDLPQWDRDYARPSTILANGRSVLIATMAGMISYHIDSKQWLLQDDTTDDLTIWYSCFTPDDDGYWQLDNQTLMHRNIEGAADTTIAIGDFSPGTFRSMTIDQKKIYIGTKDGQLLQCHPDAHELQPLLPEPEGVHARLRKILPINGLMLLAFGDGSVTMNPESDSGAVIAYNDITQQGTLLYGLGNWKDMVAIDDTVWVVGKSGVMRIPIALIHHIVDVPQASQQ